MRTIGLFVGFIVSVVVASGGEFAHAGPAGDAGICYGGGNRLEIDNKTVLTWKTTTPDQFESRAHIQGRMVGAYPDKTNHEHFSVQIGPASTDVIEIIYNVAFGDLPELSLGATVEACGDYVTSSRRSPDGAILHWVHASNNRNHEDGFVFIGGRIYGQAYGDGRD